MSNYQTDFEAPLFERDQGLKYRLQRVHTAQKRLRSSVDQLQDAMRKIHKMQDDCETAIETLCSEVPSALNREKRRQELRIKSLERELKALKKQMARAPIDKVSTVNEADLHKAKTIAIFDGILFAIENWSTDGQLAADFVMVCQAVLFPVVYDKVMGGDRDYYIDRVPLAAVEAVKRAREYVKYFRQEINESIATDNTWAIVCDEIHTWCLNDFLPLMYGARADEWDVNDSYSLAQMLQWRDQPQSRILDFPRIQDAMDLVKKHGDIIRETTGLPEFTTQTLSTRIEP